MRKNEIVLENDMIENFTWAINKLKREVSNSRIILFKLDTYIYKKSNSFGVTQ